MLLSFMPSRQACTMECPTSLGTSPWCRNLSCCTGWSKGEFLKTLLKKPAWKEFACSKSMKSMSFHQIHLFEICDAEFQRGDSGNLDNLPWNHPNMTSKIASSVCLLGSFSKYLCTSLHNIVVDDQNNNYFVLEWDWIENLFQWRNVLSICR